MDCGQNDISDHYNDQSDINYLGLQILPGTRRYLTAVTVFSKSQPNLNFDLFERNLDFRDTLEFQPLPLSCIQHVTPGGAGFPVGPGKMTRACLFEIPGDGPGLSLKMKES